MRPCPLTWGAWCLLTPAPPGELLVLNGAPLLTSSEQHPTFQGVGKDSPAQVLWSDACGALAATVIPIYYHVLLLFAL